MRDIEPTQEILDLLSQINGGESPVNIPQLDEPQDNSEEEYGDIEDYNDEYEEAHEVSDDEEAVEDISLAIVNSVLEEPVNIVTTEINERILPDKYTRFKDATWFPKEDTYVLIGGAGGVGSWLTMFLARAGFKCVVYDFDLIDATNTAGQMFRISDLGKYKVTALADIVENFTGEAINTFQERYDINSMSNNYVFSGVDNMKGRKDMFEKWLSSTINDPNALFVDSRLQMEQLTVYCIRRNDRTSIVNYRDNHLFDDASIPDAPCNLKQTTHSATMIASIMVGFFTNHLSNIATGMNVFLVPFRYEYLIPMGLVDLTR